MACRQKCRNVQTHWMQNLCLCILSEKFAVLSAIQRCNIFYPDPCVGVSLNPVFNLYVNLFENLGLDTCIPRDKIRANIEVENCQIFACSGSNSTSTVESIRSEAPIRIDCSAMAATQTVTVFLLPESRLIFSSEHLIARPRGQLAPLRCFCQVNNLVL
jgi:hypothetical protein